MIRGQNGDREKTRCTTHSTCSTCGESFTREGCNVRRSTTCEGRGKRARHIRCAVAGACHENRNSPMPNSFNSPFAFPFAWSFLTTFGIEARWQPFAASDFDETRPRRSRNVPSLSAASEATECGTEVFGREVFSAGLTGDDVRGRLVSAFLAAKGVSCYASQIVRAFSWGWFGGW